MNKRFQIFIVILSTVVCVSFILFSDKIQTNKSILLNNTEIGSNKDENTSKQNIRESKDKVNSSNVRDLNKFVITDKYKKFKMELLGQQIDQDKVDFFQQNISDNSINSENKITNDKVVSEKDQNKKQSGKSNTIMNEGVNNSKNGEVSVFNISSSKAEEKLTSSDKSKLFSVSSKLSAIDYEKVKGYLKRGSNDDITNVIELLKERLSDKEYNEIRDIANKFINKDAVQQ